MTHLGIDPYAGFVNVARFLPRRIGYSLSCRRARPSVKSAILIESIATNGIVTIPEFLSADRVDAMRDHVSGLQGFTESVEGDKALFRQNAHLDRAFSDFFSNPLLREIATGYVGVDAIPVRQIVEIRRSAGRVFACDRMYHMDTWKHRLKFFFCLQDVCDSTGPLVYLAGSHKGLWRLPMEARIHGLYRTDGNGYAASESLAYIGCYWPYEVDALQRRHRLKAIVCTATKGSLIIFDARGLHRATDLLHGDRKLLISYWVREHHHT